MQPGLELSFTQRYERVAVDMLSRCALRPFFLEQFLLYLEDKKVLRRRHGHLVPRDIDRYHEVKRDIRPNVSTLIGLRWAHLLRHKAGGCRKALEVLALFFALPEALALQVGVSRAAINRLVDAGFAERTADGQLSFYHRELFVYFRGLFRVPARAVAAKVAGTLERQQCTDAFFVPYLLAREAVNGIGNDLLDTAAAKLRGEGLHGERQDEVLQRLVGVTLERGAALAPPTALALLASAPFRLSLLAPESVTRPVLDRVHTHLWEESDRYQAFGDAYATCVYSLVNRYFGLNRYATSARLLQRTIDRFDTPSFADPREARLILARLLNRMAVIHTHLGDPRKALDCGKRARAIADELDDPLLSIECEIDLGNIYDQLMPERVDNIIAHWQRAADLLAAHPDLARSESTYPSAMVHLYQAQVMLLHRDVAGARNLLGAAVAACQKDLNNFFGIKCLVLLILSQLLEGADLDAEQASRDLERAIDWCMSTGVAHATWTVHILNAKLAARTGRNEDARRDYLLALRAYLDTDPTPAMQENRLPLFEEVFLNLRRLAPSGDTAPDGDGDGDLETLVARVTSPVVQAFYRSVMGCGADAFETLWRDYRARTTFTDGKFMLPNC